VLRNVNACQDSNPAPTPLLEHTSPDWRLANHPQLPPPWMPL